MKAIIYCRVSTIEQAEKGYSLEGQEKDCKKFALNYGYEVDKVFIERGESAKTQNRTELQKLIKYSFENRKNLSFLIIWKYDRLARNMSDHMELINYFSKLNIRILSVTENNEESSTGKLTRNMIGVISQFENDLRSERTANGMKQAIQQGRWCWKAPIGYKYNRDNLNKPIIEPSDESKYVIEAFEMAGSALYKQTDIVEKLKKIGFKRVSKNIVNRILRNPLYAGLIKVEWFPEFIPAIHKPIITKETFFNVQNILNGKKPSIVHKSRNHPDFPLRNYIRCPECGEKLTGGWSKGRNAKYPYYHCRTKGCSLNIRKEVLENNFYNYLKTFQPENDILELFEAIVIDVWKNRHEERIKEQKGYETELKNLKNKKDKLLELLIKGTLDDETYKTKVFEVDNEIMTKQIEVNDTGIEINDIEACLNYCKFFLRNIADLWLNADLNLKQRFQTLIFPDKIYINQDTFRTAVTALIFKELQVKNHPESLLVAPSGFEPESPP